MCAKVKSLFARGCLCGQSKNSPLSGFIILRQDKNCKQNKTTVEQTIDAGYFTMARDGIIAVEVWDSLIATRPVPYHPKLITWESR
jgi:hypothetical protein